MKTEIQEKIINQLSGGDFMLEFGMSTLYVSKMTDYKNKEVVIEDLDGRWIAFGLKED